MAQDRLQKILARSGIASRRKAEEIIVAGRVRVDGRVISELGSRADPNRQVIEVDGRRIAADLAAYLLLHKPRGVVSTVRDPEGRRTVADLVKGVGVRVVPVGRLDFHTSGVLFLTNDGDFANSLLHPSRQVPRVYVLKVRGEMTDEDLDAWRNGVVLDGRRTAKAEVQRLRHEAGKTWLQMTLREGQNRQIVRMGEATGFPVMRLARTEFAGLTIDGMRPGQWRPMTGDELRQIKKAYGVPKKIPRTRAGTAPETRAKAPRRPPPRGQVASSSQKPRRTAKHRTR